MFYNLLKAISYPNSLFFSAQYEQKTMDYSSVNKYVFPDCLPDFMLYKYLEEKKVLTPIGCWYSVE